MKRLSLLILIFSVLACSSSSEDNNLMMKSSMDTPSMGMMIETEMSSRGAVNPISSNDSIDKKIQKNANINVNVKDLEESLEKTNQIIFKFDGEVISTNSGGMDFGQPYANIRFRVPSENLEITIKEIKTISTELISENIYTNDVTEEFIDIEARLNIMKSTELRFNDLLSRAENVEEIIKVEKELMRIRGEIDSLQGRIDYLSKTTDTSEINLNMNEEVPITGEKWRFSNSFTSALQNFSSFAKGLADLLINIVVFLPLIIGILIIVFLIRLFMMRRKK